MLSWLLFFFLVSAAAAFVVWRIRRSKIASFVVLIVLFLIPTWDIIIGYPCFKYLCRTRSGLTIYKAVEGVEGFLDEKNNYGCGGICEESLLHYKSYDPAGIKTYHYIEVNVTKPDKKYMTVESGLHRFSRSKKGDPRCKPYYESLAGYTKRTQETHHSSKYPQDQCIAVEKIDRLSCRYAYRSYEIDRGYLPFLNIEKGESSVYDIASGEVLGIATEFLFRGSWWMKYVADFVNPAVCPEIIPYARSMNAVLRDKTLLPVGK